MLERSEAVGDRTEPRYATDGVRAYSAHVHGPDVWHGHPVGWKEVPEVLRNAWKSAGKVSRRDIKRHWDDPRTA
jgi:hypothetical protein